MSIRPADVSAPAEALEAIAHADQVVIGPGSLYTSVLAALAVPEMTEALAKTSARRVYVANLRPQRSETAGYDVARHLAALLDHGVIVDAVLCDTSGIALGDTESFGVRALPGQIWLKQTVWPTILANWRVHWRVWWHRWQRRVDT